MLHWHIASLVKS